MGGFGAFSYAARHHDLFVAAAAFSGAVDSNYQEGAAVDAVSGLDGGRPGDVFGPRASEEVRWRGHNPWDLAENLDTVDLTMRTGNGESDAGYDPLERGVWEMMTNVHERLVELKDEHVWEDYGPGTHTWPYWERDLHKTLPRFLELFESPPPAPSSFTHLNIESSYDIFGWAVKLKRPVLEFSRLEVKGPGSFRLSGTGRARVTTAPIYDGGQRPIESRWAARRHDRGRCERTPPDHGPAGSSELVTGIHSGGRANQRHEAQEGDDHPEDLGHWTSKS